MPEGNEVREIKEIIDDNEVTFRALGSAVLLSATKKVRDIKMRPCHEMTSSLSGSSMEVIVGHVNAAIETVMRHMIPGRQDLFDWLQTDEGCLFMIEESLKKNDDKKKVIAVDVFDKMNLDQLDRVQNYLLRSIAKRPETDKANREFIEKLNADRLLTEQADNDLATATE